MQIFYKNLKIFCKNVKIFSLCFLTLTNFTASVSDTQKVYKVIIKNDAYVLPIVSMKKYVFRQSSHHAIPLLCTIEMLRSVRMSLDHSFGRISECGVTHNLFEAFQSWYIL